MEQGKTQQEQIPQELQDTEPNGQEWKGEELDEQKGNEEHSYNIDWHKTEKHRYHSQAKRKMKEKKQQKRRVRSP